MVGYAIRALGITSQFRATFVKVLLAAVLVSVMVETSFAQVMVIAPHPDDEALFASGIIHSAVLAGKNVKVVILTNGDCDSHDIGPTRQQETVTAMTRLGLSANDVIFLGYPDCGIRDIYYLYLDPTSQFTSAAGFSQTYGSFGLGNTDYHRFIYGLPANYNGRQLVGDLQTVFRNYKPQDIYVVSSYDANLDHALTNISLSEAMLAQMGVDPTFQPTLHDAFVHEPCELSCDPSYHWPNPPFTPTVDFSAPPFLSMTPFTWADREQVVVPSVMQSTTAATNLKSRVIADYATQGGTQITGWLQAFVKHDEAFFVSEWWANLALKATASASSSAGTGTTASRLNDAAVVGFPVIPSIGRGGPGEWVASGLAGSWAQLTWSTPQQITRIVLHDRPDSTENITGGTLTFSDGSTIPVGALPANGSGLNITFAQKTITSVRFTVTTASGTAAGLAEFEAYGPPTTKLPWSLPSGNSAPSITGGPAGTPSSILDNATSTIAVTATDPNGDPLTYSWQVSGGHIQGSGSSVTFVPPTVISPTNFDVTVYVADGRGGIVSSTATVIVSPSNAPTNIAGAAVATASSENSARGQGAAKAIDGVVGGYPGDSQREWATTNQLAGAWIQLTWSTARTVSRSILHDRINASDQVLAGLLRFSDGSTIPIGTLPNDGAGLTTDFAARTVTWMRFEITSARGDSIGLAEWEVFSGTGGGGGSNTPPQITSGPTANPATITSAQTSSVSVTATDANNDTLSYTWSATGGTVTGSGATVTFTPPSVASTTVIRVDVSVADGHGGTATGSVNITVNPTSGGGGGSTNIARTAAPTASSENEGRGQTAAKAIDGFVDGYPTDATREWVAPGQLAGAWIQLTWPVAQSVGRVILHDRINTADQILSGTLRFSDGSTIPVGNLPNDGAGQTFDFNAKTVTWVRLEVVTARGDNTGLAEFEVYAPSGFSNASPQVTAGPTANPSAITDVQTSSISVTANDPDGDPLTYVWTTNGGSVTGTGATATFTPPRITSNTTFTVTVTIGDGRGGSVSRTVDVAVTPSSTSANRALASTATASTENSGRGQSASKAIDGMVSGYPVDPTLEWASVGQLSGAWIQLTWTSSQSITRVVLHDRINTEDQVLGGTLTFSDGSSIAVGNLANDGAAVQFDFAAKNVTWVRFTVTSARGSNIGLAEFEVY
jgi:LmbE family N-acetylglucosaminyl deacetylase